MVDAAEEVPPLPPKKPSAWPGMAINGAGVFVLALIAVVLGGFINAKLHPMPDLKLDKDGKITVVVPVPVVVAHAKADSTAGKPSLYFAIDPPLIVNFEDGAVVRFLQITMEVMARDPKAIESVKANVPLIRNNLLLLMSNRNFEALMSRDGREKLRQEALAEVRAVLKKQGGEDIDDVLFTSFVVQ